MRLPCLASRKAPGRFSDQSFGDKELTGGDLVEFLASHSLSGGVPYLLFSLKGSNAWNL
jgi:hypothetical protein